MPLETCLKRQEFLEAFLRLKLFQEVYIQELYALADKVDKAHRDCTLATVVATAQHCTLGNWDRAGNSHSCHRVSASIVDWSSKSSAETKARCLAPTDIDIEKALCQDIIFLTKNYFRGLQGTGEMVRAIKLAKVIPSFTTPAKSVTTTATIPLQSCEPENFQDFTRRLSEASEATVLLQVPAFLVPPMEDDSSCHWHFTMVLSPLSQKTKAK
ncbi:hypothetical protein MC885_010721 [Smutsia gigantea]|nr:hypothetical protein MC885_010721 [Smutsia gigantea]